MKETEFSESYINDGYITGDDFTGVVVKSGGFSGVVIKSGDSERNTIAGAVWNRTSLIDIMIAGLSAKAVHGASAFSYPIIILPFISSAFVPTKSMQPVVRVFAENQPGPR